ncbi:transposase [Rhodococcus erythropolis]|nr:transposase [Rhodococcus erythropolis]
MSDEVGVAIGPLFTKAKATGQPPGDRRTMVEATVWLLRTGGPWRDVPERFGTGPCSTRISTRTEIVTAAGTKEALTDHTAP